MNATVPQVKVGDVLILVEQYNRKPRTVNVSKVTKAGWVRFMETSVSGEAVESAAYKPANFQCGWELTVGSRYRVNCLYVYTEEKLAELNAAWQKEEDARAAKAEEWARKQQAELEQKAAELQELQAVVGTELRPLMETDLGEGKVLVFKLPVKADIQERNGTEQVVMVRVKQGIRFSVREGEHAEWEAYPTWAHKGTSSFSSCSAFRAPLETDAVWEALRYVYHNW